MSRALTLVVALLLGLVPGAASAQESGLSIRLLDVRSDQVEDPRAALYIVDAANPGATIERRVQVTNRGDAPATVDMYATAARASGGWVVEDGRQQNDLASWMDVVPSQLQLGPGQSADVTVTIRIPGDARGGERYAAVVAEPPPVTQGATQVIGRVAIRTYLFVTGEEGVEAVTDFEIRRLTAGRSEGGEPYVLISVENTGTRAIDASGELVLRDGPGGITAGPFPVSVGKTLAPGDETTLTVLLPADIPAGPWSARADLSSGEVERSAEATITFPEEAGEESAPSTATPVYRDRGVLLPVALGLLILSLLLVAVAWSLMRRGRTRTAAGATVTSET